MIQIIPKCSKCKKHVKTIFLSNNSDESYERFELTYCPRCIELGDTVPARVAAKTIENVKEKEEE